jgi:hypothetical protein
VHRTHTLDRRFEYVEKLKQSDIKLILVVHQHVVMASTRDPPGSGSRIFGECCIEIFAV